MTSFFAYTNKPELVGQVVQDAGGNDIELKLLPELHARYHGSLKERLNLLREAIRPLKAVAGFEDTLREAIMRLGAPEPWKCEWCGQVNADWAAVCGRCEGKRGDFGALTVDMPPHATQVERVHSCAAMGIRMHFDPQQTKQLSGELRQRNAMAKWWLDDGPRANNLEDAIDQMLFMREDWAKVAIALGFAEFTDPETIIERIALLAKPAQVVDMATGTLVDDDRSRIVPDPADRGRSVRDIPDAELIRRVIANIGHRCIKQLRWAHVCDRFGLGSTYAKQLCQRFGLDPDEGIGRDDPETDD